MKIVNSKGHKVAPMERFHGIRRINVNKDRNRGLSVGQLAMKFININMRKFTAAAVTTTTKY
jgi:hypothetical protein